MATNEEEHILNIKVSYDKAVEGIRAYRAEIEALKQREKALSEELENGTVTRQEYDKEVEIGKVAQKNYRDEIRTLQKEIQNNIRQQQQQEGSLKQLRAELSNATKAYDEMSRTEREGAKGKELQEHIKAITKELKGAEEETDRFYRNVGNYRNSIVEAITGNNQFASSLANLMQEGGGTLGGMFQTAIASVKSFGAALMGLMANPAFLGIAGIAGVGVAFKWFYDYNQGLAEATRLTHEFTGLTGDELVSVRNEIQAIADTMGKDYKVVEYKSEEDLRAWNEGKIDVLLAHPSSCAYGLNMQYGGHIIVWFGVGYNLELYEQACARLYRQGQKMSVQIYHLICPGTADEKAMAALRNKSSTQEAIMRDLKDIIDRCR